jgi:hypothetical protein
MGLFSRLSFNPTRKTRTPRSSIMSKFDTYKNSFSNARLTRSPSSVLEVALHTEGGKLVFNGHTHDRLR